MKIIFAAIAAGLPVATFSSSESMDLVLSERIMKLSKIAAELSALTSAEESVGSSSSSSAYNHFGFYDSEPNRALVAQKNGYCFAAFRGTMIPWDDSKQ